MKLPGKVDNGPVNKWLNFGGDPDHRLDTGFVTIGRYGKWLTDIHSYSFVRCGTGKTWLGGGMHCPSASSFITHFLCNVVIVTKIVFFHFYR